MRSRTIFLLAILMGVITTILFFQYINQTKTAAVVQDEMVQVVRAKEKIEEKQILTTDVLEVVQVPKVNIHQQAIKELSQVEGKYAAATIETGEILLAHQLKDQEKEKLLVSRKIQEGYRAVSTGATVVQTVSNLIEPEDYVDIVLTETVKVEGKEEIHSTPLFSNVRVLAVGRKMNAPVENDLTTYVEYSAITVELKPEDATKLINASAKGNIHFTLNPSLIAPTEKGDEA